MVFSFGCFVLSRRLALGAALALFAAGPAPADPIRHPTAVFAGLDKTTGRIINFDVAIEETVQFGSLQVTPRVCNTRPQTEAPQTTSFVEVDEQAGKAEQKNAGKSEAKRIFSGWMFAASPGLHGVEHPVYDVWLVDCKGGKEVAAQPAAQPAAATPPDVAAPPAEAEKPKRSRKVEPTAPAPIEAQPLGPADQPAAVAPDAPPAPGDAPAEEQPKKKKKKQPKPPPPAAAPAGDPPPPI
jgi:hypothetical protein